MFSRVLHHQSLPFLHAVSQQSIDLLCHALLLLPAGCVWASCTCKLALLGKLPGRTGELRMDPPPSAQGLGRGLVWVRWPPASSETPLVQGCWTPHLVSDCAKQMGYFGCSCLESGWLSVLGGLLHDGRASALQAHPWTCCCVLQSPPARPDTPISHKGRALLLLASGNLTFTIARDIKPMEEVLGFKPLDSYSQRNQSKIAKYP